MSDSYLNVPFVQLSDKRTAANYHILEFRNYLLEMSVDSYVFLCVKLTLRLRRP